MGSTGSGKTQFGAWVLSHAAFDKQPYVMVDYKRDTLLNSIDHVREIGLNEIPTRPGLYKVHPTPDEDEAVERWLIKVWERENTGLYFDEGYMLPSKKGLRAILTQGRSKHLPAIILSQRPTWLSRFAISEADFFAIFRLNDTDDKKTVGRFLPPKSLEKDLPEYSCVWYDVKANNLFHMDPVPNADTISDIITERLKPRKRLI